MQKVETGDLILCKMPREMDEARKKFYHEKANRALNQYDEDSIQGKFERQAREAGLVPFGGIKIEGQQKQATRKYYGGWSP
jgi:hypothetical protein